MKKWNNKVIRTATASTALAAALPATKVLAVDYEYSTTDAAAGTAAAGIFGGLLIFWLIMMVALLAFFIFWIVMLIDAFKRTNWQDESQKNTWLIVLIVSFFVGLYGLAAILYYFMVKRALDKGNAPAPTQAPASTPPPADKK